MERQTVVLTMTLLVLTLVLVGIFLFTDPTLSPEKQSIQELEECKTLTYNGENKINIVFLSPKDTAELYEQFFLTISPLNNNQDAFNFYYIDNYQPKCEIYKDIALLCYSKELIKKASSCPSDYIITIQSQSEQIRSSSYMNVMSINSKHPLTVLSHEFGHSFVNLAEEYTPADIPSGSQNCQSTCDKFNIKDGCYQGCSKDNYQRSIDNGIMRTLSSNNYGIFNEQIIQNKINTNKNSITGSAITTSPVDCSQQQYYLIEAQLSNNQITIIDKSIQIGCISQGGAGNFNYKLILQDNTILTEQEFNPELIFTDSPNSGNPQIIEGQTYINEGNFLLKIPIIENSKSIQVFNPDNQILKEINLQNFNTIACKI